MFKRKNNKKGFTIVELTIVVSVIAILSAVLIPTFAGITKRARLSADEQAVRSINLELAAADADDLANLTNVEKYLTELGYTIEDYKPVSKNYKLAYSASLKKVVLLNADNKVVYPTEYANETVTVEYTNNNTITELETADDIALIATSRGGDVNISKDLALDTAMYLTKNTTIELNGNVSVANDTVGDGVFCAQAGKLTLNGEGTVNGVGQNYYQMAVWAKNGAEIVINGGTYTNVGAKEFAVNGPDNTPCNYELLYVSDGGKITINGGTFQAENPEWTLNSKDGTRFGTIEIKGGKFYKYNPKTDSKDATVYVADGYTVEQDGDWYKVVKA